MAGENGQDVSNTPEMPSNLANPAMPPTGATFTTPSVSAPAAPTSTTPGQPHARLVSMLQGLFLGIDSFAKAAATGGKEGGVQEVEQVQQARAASARANAQQQQELKESNVRIQHTQAQTNLATAQLQVLQHDAPLAYQQKILETQRGMVDLFKDMGLDPSFVMNMTEGEDTGTVMNAVSAKASGDLVNNTAIPVHDEKFGGSGTISGYPFSLLNKQVTMEQATPQLMKMQGAIETAKGVLGDNDPAVKLAQGKLDQFRTGSTVSAADLLHFQQQTLAPMSAAVNRKESLTKFQTTQAELKQKQQATDPMFKMENDPAEMAGEKASSAIALLQNKITAPDTSPQDKVRATRLLAQAKSARQGYLNDQASKANAEQQAKQGDPNEAGKLLANGSLTLADMKTRGMTPKFMQQSIASAQGINPQYKPADEVIAEQVAKSPAASQFFGSANSLISKGGTLDQVQEAGTKLPNHTLPVFNSIADAKNYATGHPEVAAYLQSALGAADDYAKVMGGGQGTEGMQLHILKGLTAAQNQEQRQAVIASMKGAVNSQVESRIGTNQFLKRMYGYALPGPAQSNFNPATELHPIKAQ